MKWKCAMRSLPSVVSLTLAFVLCTAGCDRPEPRAGTAPSAGATTPPSKLPRVTGDSSQIPASALEATPGPAHLPAREITGLQLDVLPEARSGSAYGILDATGKNVLSQVEDANEVVTVPAGTYVLYRYGNRDFVYARDVAVTAGSVTRVAMGGLQLDALPEAKSGSAYGILDATGRNVLSLLQDPNEVVTVPAGTYVLYRYGSRDFVYARDVVVTAGNVTRVAMGGLELDVLPEAKSGSAYGILDATGKNVLSLLQDPNEVVTVPAGTYVLYRYGNRDFVYARDVAVTAGSVTRVAMGGLRLNGSAQADFATLDAHGKSVLSLLDRPNTVVTVPAGTYLLAQYAQRDNVYARDVVVTAGSLTEVSLPATGEGSK